VVQATLSFAPVREDVVHMDLQRRDVQAELSDALGKDHRSLRVPCPKVGTREFARKVTPSSTAL